MVRYSDSNDNQTTEVNKVPQNQYGYDKQYGKGRPMAKRAEDEVAKCEPVHNTLLGLARSRDEAWSAIETAARLMYGTYSIHTVSFLLATELGSRLYTAYLHAPIAELPTPPNEVAAGVSNDEQDTSAWAEIVNLAKRLIQESDSTMTLEQAVAAVMSTPRGTVLYRRYLAEVESIKLCSPAGKKLYKEYLHQKEELITKRHARRRKRRGE